MRTNGFSILDFRFWIAVAVTAVCGGAFAWVFAAPDQPVVAAPPAVVAAKPEPKSEPAKPEPAKPAAKEGAAAADKNAKAKNITFDTIKFEMEKTDPYDRELIGPKIEKLVGRKIRIRGYVHPSSSFSQTMRKFVLVRDNLECCFGPGAALFDCIIVTMKPEKTAQYTTSPVTVEGIFRIEEEDDPLDPEANPQAIYQMEAEAVE